MKGMIKKDLLMIKNNRKVLAFTIILYIAYSFMFDMDMSFFLPLMGLMTCISTLNYDEYNNWYTYASALPQGRENVVKSKYLVSLIILVVLSLIGIITSIVILNSKGNIKIDNIVSAAMGEVLALILMMSVLYPVLFKYGSEKGRIAIIILGFGMYGIGILISKCITVKLLVKLITFFNKYFILIFICTSILFISISYAISKRIYLKKEF